MSVSNHIQSLIAQGEHEHLDFKYEINDARKIAKSFVAFANSGGGKLLIGVKDNGNIAGIRSEEEQYMVEAAATYYCTPVVSFFVKKWELDGKTILEVDIPEGMQKPYYVRQKEGDAEAYVRVKDKNIKTCNVQLIAWKKQQQKSGLMIRNVEEEGHLLQYLTEHPVISFSQAYRLLLMSRKQTEQLLGNLVYLGIIEIEYANGKTLFRMKQ